MAVELKHKMTTKEKEEIDWEQALYNAYIEAEGRGAGDKIQIYDDGSISAPMSLSSGSTSHVVSEVRGWRIEDFEGVEDMEKREEELRENGDAEAWENFVEAKKQGMEIWNEPMGEYTNRATLRDDLASDLAIQHFQDEHSMDVATEEVSEEAIWR